MLLITDVHYLDDGTATAAGVLFEDWKSAEAIYELTTTVYDVAPYEPGSFYKRELPCLKLLLAELQRRNVCPDLIIVDGFVHLGEEQTAGLGAHLHEALGGLVPIVGIAKTGFHGTPSSSGVLRGKSEKPLFVTSVGIDSDAAKAAVQSMHGEHRLPTMVTRVDALCRRPTPLGFRSYEYR